jgi:phenylalanyl-tRNA synthetase beta chain
MKVLHSWLRKYTPVRMSPDALTERLTMLGLEFESVENLGEAFEGFVVGRVVTAERHPAADTLSVCSVDVGSETLQIVCGAPNVAAGQRVAVGRVGAVVPRGQKDGAPFTLGTVTIRGVESHGMICSEYELGLGKDAEGIMVLPQAATPGRPLADALDLRDVVYDVEVTPNRPDWLSHIGVAREIAVLTGRGASLPTVKLRETGESIRRRLSIRVEDPMNCPRFAARMIRGVRIGPSPPWLQNALRNVGLRPRNAVVDITNYVMLECGHPLHAFDYALLRGGSIVVRQATEGSLFATLDGKKHTLPRGAVMVCDAEREVSIAGIMGGENSEINDATTDVVLEAAYWNPSSIRRTAKALGISTDASQRFERGADPNGIDYALDRAAELVVRLAGGKLLAGRVDVYPKKIRPARLTLRTERVNALLGTSLTRNEIAKTLALLDIRTAKRGADVLVCTIPTRRVDLTREVDLIEEVARVYGYDRIEEKKSAFVDFSRRGKLKTTADLVRTYAVGAGFKEAISNSMVDQKRASLAGTPPVTILNPLSQDMAYMRTSLVPGLLEALAHNINYGSEDAKLFEIGHVFARSGLPGKALVEGYQEEERLAVLITGQVSPRQWGVSPRQADLYDLKGEIESLLRETSLDKWRLISYSTSDGLTEATLAIEIHNGYAGYLGRVKDEVLRLFSVKQDVYVAELSLGALEHSVRRAYTELPKYPKVRRDVAFTVARDVLAGDIMKTFRESAGSLLTSIDVFDVFEGGPLGAEKKSLGFSLELMSKDRTLTDTEIEETVRRSVSEVERRHNAVLRSAS